MSQHILITLLQLITFSGMYSFKKSRISSVRSDEMEVRCIDVARLLPLVSSHQKRVQAAAALVR